jgi:hypothetical protein
LLCAVEDKRHNQWGVKTAPSAHIAFEHAPSDLAERCGSWDGLGRWTTEAFEAAHKVGTQPGVRARTHTRARTYAHVQPTCALHPECAFASRVLQLFRRTYFEHTLSGATVMTDGHSQFVHLFRSLLTHRFAVAGSAPQMRKVFARVAHDHFLRAAQLRREFEDIKTAICDLEECAVDAECTWHQIASNVWHQHEDNVWLQLKLVIDRAEADDAEYHDDPTTQQVECAPAV